MRKRTSPIWEIPKEEFLSICKKSKTISEIMRICKLNDKGGNRKTIFARIKEDNIGISHIPLGYSANRNRRTNFQKNPIEYFLVEHCKSTRFHIKKRLINEDLLKNECCICGLKDIWNGKSISMILDHINGVSDDYRIENLRLVCPNCNSQLDTFTGRNIKKEKKKYLCMDCGIPICHGSIRCHKCHSISRRKIPIRPSKEYLLKEIEEKGYVRTGKKYGVSDNAIRKWLN